MFLRSQSVGKAQESTGRAVTLAHVTKTYLQGNEVIKALDDVSVTFPVGRFTSIMGPSGSGKTTLLYAAAGLTAIDGGEITHGEQDIFRLNDRRRSALRRDTMGFIFQSYNLFPDLTAERNITLPSRLARQRVDKSWLAEVTDRLGIGDRLGHTPGQLSGGQQQRVAIARSLYTKPNVIFADEPTGALDSTAAQAVMETLRMCADDYGQTIVMVTHDREANSYADHQIRMRDGRIDACSGHGKPLQTPEAPGVNASSAATEGGQG